MEETPKGPRKARAPICFAVSRTHQPYSRTWQGTHRMECACRNPISPPWSRRVAASNFPSLGSDKLPFPIPGKNSTIRFNRRSCRQGWARYYYRKSASNKAGVSELTAATIAPTNATNRSAFSIFMAEYTQLLFGRKSSVITPVPESEHDKRRCFCSIVKQHGRQDSTCNLRWVCRFQGWERDRHAPGNLRILLLQKIVNREYGYKSFYWSPC